MMMRTRRTDMKDLILNELTEARQTLDQFLSNQSNICNIEEAASLMSLAILNGKKIPFLRKWGVSL